MVIGEVDMGGGGMEGVPLKNQTEPWTAPIKESLRGYSFMLKYRNYFDFRQNRKNMRKFLRIKTPQPFL